MKIIVGLGNPEEKYKKTRHNIGEAITSSFQEANNFPTFQLKKRLNSLISEGKIDEEKIILALPQTFMNESGQAIQKLIRNWKLEIRNLIIIHDDLDMTLGKIRIKVGGSSGGHNGVQSIINHLKTEDFIRIKIGIASEKKDLVSAEKFVLEKFTKEEQKIIEKIIKKSKEIILNLITTKEIKKETVTV